jgi:hypothetical protein
MQFKLRRGSRSPTAKSHIAILNAKLAERLFSAINDKDLG